MARTAVSGRTVSTRTNNVLYNGNFEVRPPSLTAGTNTGVRWIDGTAGGSAAVRAYGWGILPAAVGNAEAAFDTTIKRSGAASMKLSTLTNAGFITVGSYRQVPSATLLNEVFFLRPNTSYTFTGYVRTNNVAANGAFVDIREYGSTSTILATNSTNKLAGTDTTFRTITSTFTTNASTVFGSVLLRLNVTGNISDANFDDLTLTPANTGRNAANGRIAA